jgi:hypothetical protein
VRVLISIAPRSYREALALTLQQQRTNLEVKVAPPEGLDQEVGGFEPHLVVCNETTPLVRANVLSRVEILFENSLDARVTVNDRQTSRVEDIGMDDLLRAIDETEKMVSRG